MNGKRWAALIIAFALLVLSVVSQIATNEVTTDDMDPLLSSETTFEESVVEKGLGTEKIAILHLEGVIQDVGEVPFVSGLTYDHQSFLKMIDKAAEDRNVEGIILRVNTPGGGVVESAEVHEKLVKISEDYEKPIYVSMGGTAASGGYYVSAPADKIVAHPATLTGSIGVIMENIEFSELASDYGIDFNTIKSGKYKDIMSSSRPMTDDEEAILQSMIDELYEEFVQVIVDGRDMPVDRVKELGDGRIYTGKQALEEKLVDELGSLEDTIALMKSDHDLGSARVIEYKTRFSIGQWFGFSAQNIFKSDNEILNILNIIRQSDGPRAMYLYSK